MFAMGSIYVFLIDQYMNNHLINFKEQMYFSFSSIALVWYLSLEFHLVQINPLTTKSGAFVIFTF
jgi:hypothetical protein